MRRKIFVVAAAATAILLAVSVAPAAPADVVSLEAGGGVFLPGSKDFRTSYKAGPAFGLDLTVSVASSLAVWAGAGYFAKSGLTSFTEEPLKIRLVPLYAGLRVRLSGGTACPYLGAAAGYFLYREESETAVALGGAVGFLGQAGLLVGVGRNIALDIYGRYSYARVREENFASESSQIGGFEAGLGLVVCF